MGEKTKKMKETWRMVFVMAAATVGGVGVDQEDRVAEVAVVEEVLDLGLLLIATTHHLPLLLIALIVRSKLGLVAKNSNKVFKNQKWVSLILLVSRSKLIFFSLFVKL